MIFRLICIATIFAISFDILADELYVQANSMAPSYFQGEKIKIDECEEKCSYIRGKVYAFKYPLNTKVTYFKRLIGLPGDKVKIAGDSVILNGDALNRLSHQVYQTEYGVCLMYSESINLEYYGICIDPDKVSDKYDHEVLLGNDEYYFLGDNRQHTIDSRSLGAIKAEFLLGEVSKIE